MATKKNNEPVMIGSKTCIACKCDKPVSLFHAHKQMKDGRINKCAECVVAAVEEWRKKNEDCRKIEHARNREKAGFKTREQWAKDIKEGAKGKKVTGLEWYRRNVQAVAAYRKKYAEDKKDQISARNKAWARQKREAKNADFLSKRLIAQNRRRASELRAVPKWADHEVIAGMYQVAQLFRSIGIDMQVDHIVPLQGKTVSGFHTHDNLQLMVGSKNSAKHNRYWPDQP